MVKETLQLLIYIIFMTLIGRAALVDYKKLQIPNGIVLMLFFIGVLGMFFKINANIIETLVGATAVTIMLFSVSYFSKGALGMGDVKLMSAIGLLMGFWNTMTILLMASLFCGLGSIVLLALGRVTKRSKIPFAPFIFISTTLFILTIN